MKNIKKFISNLLFIFILLFSFNLKVDAKEVNVYIFYGQTCPHCEAALEYLNSIKDKYELNIYKYEVWNNQENKNLMKEISSFLDFNVRGVPFTIINNTPISGYSKKVTDETYRYNIKQASKDNFVDKVGIKLGVIDASELEKESIKHFSKKEDNNDFIVKLPLLGKVNLKKISLPIVSILLGILDGFNPCAMWILLFLISILIGVKDKKKLWILSVTFFLTSVLVYLAFMVSWLEFAKMISGVIIVRTLISIFAIISGAINLNDFANSIVKDEGCNVANVKKRKNMFSKIMKFTHKKSFVIAILGIIFFALSVNLIELACSAGFSTTFTQLLDINNLLTYQYFIYIILYILFFILDDLIIFVVTIKSIELAGISTKYSKYSHLIRGILMFIIGILLLVKPEWLMFNF